MVGVFFVLYALYLLVSTETTLGRASSAIFLTSGVLAIMAAKVHGARLRTVLNSLPFFVLCVLFAVFAEAIWARLFFGILAFVQVPFFFLRLKGGSVRITSDGLLIKQLGMKHKVQFKEIVAVRPYTSSLPRFLAGDPTIAIELRDTHRWWQPTYLNIPPDRVPNFIADVSRRIQEANSVS
jgi:hypothetical protein